MPRKSFRLIVGLIIPLLVSASADASKFHRYEKKVPGLYIVEVASKDVNTIRRLAKDATVKHKAKVIDVYTEIFGGFVVELSESGALALSEWSEIKGVHEVVAGSVIEASVATAVTAVAWGLDRLDQRNSALDGWYNYYYRGSDVTVYILDTGVDEVGDLQGRISEKVTFAGTGTQDCFQPNGHGTQVASTVGGSTYGVARGVRLVSVRTACGTNGANNLISALQWVAQRHNDTPSALSVVNISLQYTAYDPIDAAVRDAIAAGVVVVVGAGNDNRSACTSSPQRAGNAAFIKDNPNGFSAITVAASDVNDRVSYYGVLDGKTYASNTGQCVDIFAPGGPGLVAQGATSVDTTWQGTSAAAPHVAGLAALTLAKFGSVTPGMVENYILQNATSNVIRDNPDGATMLSSTPNNLAYQVLPPKRRACCSF